jgi:hypothetical protein
MKEDKTMFHRNQDPQRKHPSAAPTGGDSGSGSGGPKGQLKKPPTESLSDIGKRLRAALLRSATSETEVSIEVAAMAKRWDEDYRHQAGDVEIEKWLRSAIDSDRPLKWYVHRAEAAKALPGLTDCVTSKALVWAYGKLPNKAAIDQATADIRAKFREKGSTPLRESAVVGLCSKYVSQSASRMTKDDQIRVLRERVRRLEAQIRELGADPVE